MLEIKNLEVLFADSKAPGGVIRAVDGIDLKIRRGSCTSIVGESGSGKSVTALSICRLITAQHMRGHIFFSENLRKPLDLLSASSEELLGIRGKRIAYIFQDPGSSLNPVLRVGPQVDEAVRAHLGLGSAEMRKKTLAMLNAVKLRDAERVCHSYAHELSGGMKQRVMIAMALVTGAELLIADEPTTALDSETEFEILELLATLRRQGGLTVLFITHQLALASAYADAIYVMHQGKIVERMSKENGSFRPLAPYTQKLFKARLQGAEPKRPVRIE